MEFKKRQQEAREGADRAGNIGCGRACVVVRTVHEEGIDIGQAKLPPRLARAGEVLEQLADMIELLENRDLRVSAMLRQVLGVGSQIEEHHAVRNTAGIFDVSHMCVCDLHGRRVRDKD